MEGAFERLAWDSELFGFDVARIATSALRDSGLAHVLADLRDRRVVLAYGALDDADARSAAAAERAGGRLVDVKVTYIRELTEEDRESDPEALASVADSGAREASPELERLALQSGAFSRFRTDPAVPDGVFERLYRTWIRRSVAREIADRVLVVGAPGEAPGGMVTLRFDGEVGSIGLLAVESGVRGHGHGRLLLRAAHDEGRAHGCSLARLVTQAANAPACRLFEAAGYRVERRERIFHFWLTKGPGAE